MWKTIVDYPQYEINEFGVVRNAATCYVTTQRMNKSGYLFVQLIKDGKNHCCLVHRLVAEAFIPNPDKLPVVNHIDECCVHNAADNLEWVSYQSNSNHGTRNERIVRERKIPIIGFDEDGITKMRFSCRYDAARSMAVSEHAVRAAMKNHNRCRKLFWRAAQDETPKQEYQANKEWIDTVRLLKDQQRPQYHTKGPVAVKALNDNGDVLFSFSSITEAANTMGVSAPAISSAIRNKTNCKELKWIIDSK